MSSNSIRFRIRAPNGKQHTLAPMPSSSTMHQLKKVIIAKLELVDIKPECIQITDVYPTAHIISEVTRDTTLSSLNLTNGNLNIAYLAKPFVHILDRLDQLAPSLFPKLQHERENRNKARERVRPGDIDTKDDTDNVHRDKRDRTRKNHNKQNHPKQDDSKQDHDDQKSVSKQYKLPPAPSQHNSSSHHNSFNKLQRTGNFWYKAGNNTYINNQYPKPRSLQLKEDYRELEKLRTQRPQQRLQQLCFSRIKQMKQLYAIIVHCIIRYHKYVVESLIFSLCQQTDIRQNIGLFIKSFSKFINQTGASSKTCHFHQFVDSIERIIDHKYMTQLYEFNHAILIHKKMIQESQKNLNHSTPINWTFLARNIRDMTPVNILQAAIAYGLDIQEILTIDSVDIINVLNLQGKVTTESIKELIKIGQGNKSIRYEHVFYFLMALIKRHKDECGGD